MAKKNDVRHQETLNALYENGGVVEHAALSLDIPASTYRRNLRAAQQWAKSERGKAWSDEKAVPTATPEIIQLGLKKEIKALEAALKAKDIDHLDTEKVRQHYLGLAAYKPYAPSWITKPKKSLSEHGTPTLMLSDYHWMETVNPAEVFYSNEYNHAIAIERHQRVIDRTIYLLKEKLSCSTYPGIVVILGGDMVSGIIHPELQETNEHGPMVMMLDCADHLAEGIRKLQAAFGKVYVLGVPGNHGRLTMKSYAKLNAVYNCDWGIYQMIERFLKPLVDKGNVVFNCPPVRDLTFSVEGHSYRLSHGDQFGGGSAIGVGALGPVMRGDMRKRTMAMKMPGRTEEYETLIVGHYHQLNMLFRLIMNGSLKGFCEFAMSCNFSWEPAQQALWLTHRNHGPNHFMPVFAQDPKKPTIERPAMVSWRPGDMPTERPS